MKRGRGRGHFLREMFRSLAVGFPPPEILPQDNLHPSNSSLSFFLFLYLYPFPSLASTPLSSRNSLVFALVHPATSAIPRVRLAAYNPRATLPLVTLTPEKWAGGAAKTWRGQ